MKVVLASTALADLEGIGDHIALDNPKRAASFVAELKGQANSLGNMPRAFPLIPRYEHHGIRRRAFGST